MALNATKLIQAGVPTPQDVTGRLMVYGEHLLGLSELHARPPRICPVDWPKICHGTNLERGQTGYVYAHFRITNNFLSGLPSCRQTKAHSIFPAQAET